MDFNDESTSMPSRIFDRFSSILYAARSARPFDGDPFLTRTSLSRWHSATIAAVRPSTPLLGLLLLQVREHAIPRFPGSVFLSSSTRDADVEQFSGHSIHRNWTE
jgi:hypothetical protein